MKRAVLFCNGDLHHKDFHFSLIKDDDYIIAVDGGGNHCRRLGITPNLVLGDFDSLETDLLSFYKKSNIEIIGFPVDKNFIDLALGIDEAINRHCDEILVLGALGGKRLDMEMANILVLSRYKHNIIIADENRSVRVIFPDEMLVINNKINEYFSLIPLTEKVLTGESSGLKYQLLDLEFTFGETRSVSNEILLNECSILLKKGKALAICQKK